MRSSLVQFVAFTLGSCATVPTAAIRGDGFARLGEATRVGALVVTPRTVIEDSRCPMNARCVWAGRAIVRTEVVSGGRCEMLDLTLGERMMMRGTTLTLTLTSVEPGKMAGAQPDPPPPTLSGFEGGR